MATNFLASKSIGSIILGNNASNNNQPQIGYTQISSASTTNYGMIGFGTTTPSTTLCWTAGGFVGIGTTAPSNFLTITQLSSNYTKPLLVLDAGIAGATGAIGAPRGIGQPLIGIGNTSYTPNGYLSGGDYYGIGFGFGGASGGSNYYPAEIGFLTESQSGSENGSIVFSTRATTTNIVTTERMRITGAGKVGVGTNAPAAPLHVYGIGASSSYSSPHFSIESSTDSGRKIIFGTDGTSGSIQSVSAGPATAWLALNPLGGNVGIGTNAPPYKLSLMTTTTSAVYDDYVYSTQIITGSASNGYAYGGYMDGGTKVGRFTYLALGLATAQNAVTKTQIVMISDQATAVAVTGSMSVSGTLSKGGGSFDIEHPLYPSTKKRLVHSFIEGPRCDLIYRGTKQLINGTITIDINKECTYNPEGSMDDGTFEALCANAECFLQNKSGFDRVIGSIQGAILTITCENNVSSDIINWMVIAERIDTNIKEWNRTDSNGFLITQYTNIQ